MDIILILTSTTNFIQKQLHIQHWRGSLAKLSCLIHPHLNTHCNIFENHLHIQFSQNQMFRNKPSHKSWNLSSNDSVKM